jgi:two-component system response regulator HydG
MSRPSQGLYNNKGEFLVVVGLITDIQGQKQVEYRLIEENRRLKASIKDRGGLVDLVGRSTGMQKIYDLILKAAESNRPVAVTGESGTGKELTAMAIHELSAERESPFVAVNCGSLDYKISTGLASFL